MKHLSKIPISIIIIFIFYLNSIHAQTGSNPIFRDVFTADPAPLVYDGRLYVYVGHDEAFADEMFNITEWLCYSTTDMVNWTAHGSVMRPEHFRWNPNNPNAVQQAWAAQCVYKDGKFYLYTTVTYNGRNVGVAVSDSPTGPFVDARGSALISDGMTNNGDPWDDIDPTVLIDDDGTAYLSWGNPNCYLAKLKPNMIELDGAIEMITPPHYGEGPWLSKRNNLYYLTYAAFPTGGSEQICYATATNIHGPWTYQGILTGAARGSYTIHPGLVNYKGNDYLFYHFADYSIGGYTGTLGRRSVCVEYLCYNEDGTMQPVTQTLAGITVPPPCPSEQVPQISFTSPQTTSFAEPANITISVDVTDGDGQITDVVFFNGTQQIHQTASAPYSTQLSNLSAGNYTIRVEATDNDGNTSESSLNIKVNEPQGPYGGTPVLVTDKIEFENFDVGGNGFAYFDDTPGTQVDPAPNYRTDEDVDIENCTDAGNGYNVGWAAAGEWLEYTVSVPSTGTYNLIIRASCNGDDRTVSLSYDDGTAIANNIVIPNTAGWQEWTDVEVNDIELQKGTQVLRLTIGATDFVNLNYMTFVPQTFPPVVEITSPPNNSEFAENEPLTIAVTATSTTSTIAQVHFYFDNELVSTDNTAPYSFLLEELSPGSKTIKVEAIDADGLSSSEEISVVILEVIDPIILKAGWNIIGYPYNDTALLEDALADIWNEIEVIKDFNGFYDKNGPANMNSLSNLEYGKGYFIRVSNNCEINWNK